MVTDCRFHDGRPIVGLAGVASINDAEMFRGCELRVPDEALPKLGEGQYWYHELIGCDVVTASGREVGKVVRIDEGATDLLVVQGDSGEVLVPMIDRICRRFDVAGRRIEIEPIAGLLEVNARHEPGDEEGGKRRGR